MGFATMGLRFLERRKKRTALTIIAIAMGVGILTGINVTADSIDVAISMQINQQLGNNDIIVRSNRSIEGGWFSYADGNSIISGIDGVKSTVPRIVKSHPSYPRLNHSSGFYIPIIGIDSDNAAEKTFGTSNITSSLFPEYLHTNKIETLLSKNVNGSTPTVISKSLANSYGLKVGDPYYFYPEVPAIINPAINRHNTSTWVTTIIVGIIEDGSEAVTDFTPPANIWELYPPSKAVYVDIDFAWKYIFNNHSGQVNMIFVHINNPANAEIVIGKIRDINNPTVFPGKVYAENVKSLFTSGISEVNFLMRGIFSIFAAISLLVCAIIIKNLLEMAKEEQTHEIGIMRAVGVTKSKILTLYISQILFISIIGSLVGLFIGYFLSNIFMNSYVDTANAVGTDFSDYQIKPVMTGMTVLIGMGSGVLISLIFGYFPARAAANVDPLEALRSATEKPKNSLLQRTIKKSGGLSITLAMIFGGIIMVGSSFGGLFILDVISPEVIILLFLGVIFLVIGIVLLAAFFFPVLVHALSVLFKPFLREMKVLTSRNLIRYSRQTKNTFAMLAIGLCMMITVGTIMNSAYAGAYPGGKTIVGGDLQIGNLYQGHVPKDPHTKGLKNLDSVAQAVPIRFSIGLEGLTRIDRISTNETFGGKSDSRLGTVKESFHLGIIEPEEYGKLHSKDSIVKLKNKEVTLQSLMKELNNPYSIILQDRMARQLGQIEEGEWVRVRFEGFEAEFYVVGIFEVLPGFLWSYYESNSAFDKQFCGAISWNAYEVMVDDNLGNADIIARNKIVPDSNMSSFVPDESLWGYVSTPLDYQTLESVALQTGLVKNISNRITSPFWGLPAFKWNNNASSNFSLSTVDDTVLW
jgi:ABC-type antimicrobial peptide transport system permease subunit